MSVKILIVGAGSRGLTYADYVARFPQEASVVGVAEPRAAYRDVMVKQHHIPAANVFDSWEQMAARPKMADAVIIATSDTMHLEPVLAFAEKGYHILLEKPMAPDKDECIKIVNAAEKAGVIFAVCHVLRYTGYIQKIKEIIDSGAIGEVVNIQHIEPVAYWHMAHSFVRGNWRNEAESSFMLLAKSCHDMDLIRYLVGVPCTAVSSFGSLKHFRKENQPKGAADRCLACSVESHCPYSAKRFYLGKANAGNFGWPVDVITRNLTLEGVVEALEKGPYGRCVYACDNDVVDNQVVNMTFENGCTVAFTMMGFGGMGDRATRIFGTRGQIDGDFVTIKVFDFLTDTEKTLNPSDQADIYGHGGGDDGLMKAFIAAVKDNDPSKINTSPREILDSHLLAFAGEKARRENRVVLLKEMQ